MIFSEAIKDSSPGSVLWDKDEKDSVKGLHLKTSETGRKVFYLYYTAKSGQQRRPKIGEYKVEISLATARNIALKWWESIAAGGDPSAERQLKRSEPTLAEVFETAMKEHWGAQRYVDSGWHFEVKRHWEKHIKNKFGSEKVTEITAPLIRDWHHNFKDVPYEGNRCKAVLSKLFKFSEEKGWRQPQSNPCSAVPNFGEVARDRYASQEEFKKIVDVLERESISYPEAVAFIYLLIFTGGRNRAIEEAKWDQISVVEGTMVLVLDGKSGREVLVLPAQAVKALSRFPKPKDGTLTGIKFPRGLWKKICSELGIQGLWGRDFRRFFASVGLGEGISIDKIGRSLNHRSQQTTLVYAKIADPIRIDTSKKIADKIESIVASVDKTAASE